ncbi:hypothetical protein ACWD8I_07020 [Micromonospora arida]|uniref:hypothetical protein n=1 Tax=Micromonospora arida TaxID=2203715 RepID=UPI0033A00F13
MRGRYLGDILKQMDHVDDVDVVGRAASSPALQTALEWSRPRNWWGIGIDPLLLFNLARDAGIPLAWVPRGEIIRELVAAPSKSAMNSTLVRRSALVLEDCSTVVAECTDERLQDQLPLAEAAIAAYCGGHPEAAMALAVSLSEPLALWASTKRFRSFDSREERDAWERRLEKVRKYRLAEFELGAEPPDKRFGFKDLLVMAPIPRFFTPWFPDQGAPQPEALSRHVVAHQPTVQHFSAENCLVAIMLMASLLRQQQDFCEALEPSDVDEG